MAKRIGAIVLVLLMLIPSSCCSPSTMPFNGNIQFHSISLTVPQRFIRDSTQSNDDLWIFLNSNYSEYILISRSDVTGDVPSALADYAESMFAIGAECSIVAFLGRDAVASTYYSEDMYCQEILFYHDNSLYAVALRGGTESDFLEITNTITLIGGSEIVPV